MTRLGYFVTESSEHFAEYVPWFIKRDRPDLIEKFGIPLDEYPQRCIENVAKWKKQAQEYRDAKTIEVKASHEYASEIINSAWTGAPSVIYGNVPNRGLITSLPEGCAVEVPCLVDRNGIQPTRVGKLPPQLAALMRTNVNVQELTVAALHRGEPRAHLPRGDARPAHRRRARPRPDLAARRPAPRPPRRLAAGLGAAQGRAHGGGVTAALRRRRRRHGRLADRADPAGELPAGRRGRWRSASSNPRSSRPSASARARPPSSARCCASSASTSASSCARPPPRSSSASATRTGAGSASPTTVRSTTRTSSSTAPATTAASLGSTSSRSPPAARWRRSTSSST